MPSQSIATTMDRLWELLSLLPEHAPGATSSELTALGNEKFAWSVTKRTVDRNLKSLHLRGLARTVEDPKKRKRSNTLQHWIAEAEHNLNAPRMGTADALAIHLIAHVADSLLPPEIVGVLRDRMEDARTHLERRRKVDQRAAWATKISVLPNGFALRPPAINKSILHVLQRALLVERQIYCAYRSNERSAAKHYPLEPRALVLRGTFLYLIASRPDKPAKKTTWYRVDRFQSAKLLEKAVAPIGFRLDEYLAGGGGEYGAEDAPIRFEAWVSNELKDQLSAAPLSADMTLVAARGGAIITATVWQSWLFEIWILGRARDLRVIAPAALRDKIAERHLRAWEAYQAA